ncbi:hypothetical protein AB0C86_11175 [Streptomyces lavendulae]|uniref:hypothetical protein n=1 Tax=Streptomyces lavendulae TaxID=1914 RepID=UPI0033D5C123
MAFNNALDAVDRGLIRVPQVDNDYAMQIVDLLGERFHPGLGVPCRVVCARERPGGSLAATNFSASTRSCFILLTSGRALDAKVVSAPLTDSSFFANSSALSGPERSN